MESLGRLKVYKNFLIASIFVSLSVFVTGLIRGDSDFSHFIVLGDRLVDENIHPYPVKIHEDSWGYDGQYFYAYSLKPNLKEKNYLGVPADPKYRKQRILYPLVVWILSFGSPYAVPVVMVLVNLIAIFLVAYMAFKFVKEANAPPVYILLIGCLVGSHIALVRDLAEAFEALFLSVAIWSFFRNKIWGFIAASTAALLTRETALLIIFPGILAWAYKLFKLKKGFHYQYLILIIPIGVLTIWKAYLMVQYGMYKGDVLQWMPFKGILDGIRINIQDENLANHTSILRWGYIAFKTFLIAWIWFTLVWAVFKMMSKSKPFDNWGKWALIIWMVFGSFLSYKVFECEFAYMRVFNGILLVSFFMLAANKIRLPSIYLVVTLGMYFTMLIRIVL